MSWTRRAWLRSISVTALAVASRDLAAHIGTGPVDPLVPAPDIWVLDATGQRRRLPELLLGKATAVQTMFTGCSSVCPLQGAMFGAVQEGLARSSGRRPKRLLSLSIDPLGDTPQSMQAWLRQMNAGPSWAGVIPVGDARDLRSALAGRPPDANLDRHTTQVYFFNAAAQLCWRSPSLPEPGDIVTVLDHLANT
ncbi:MULTISPECIES: SCO family protein [Cupriavidus]|jgi:protein SCO1/2|uniref:SCO family protein n=1 Tax=Cupriavidus TaxID=106589 RepID=UPI00168B4C2B|nr:SCO family protein [Cupriavidus pauculus]